MIMLGLLGTFFGLFVAIQEINIEGLTGLAEIDGGLRKAMLNKSIGGPMQGMKLAFLTSIVGISCSMLLSWGDSKRRADRESFLLDFEDYLSNDLLQKYVPSSWEETGKQVAKEMGTLGEVLKTSLQEFLTSFSTNIQQHFQVSMQTVTGHLVETAEKVDTASSRMGELADSFSAATTSFRSSSQKFSQTVDDLPANIATMEVNLTSFLGNFQSQSDNHLAQVTSQQKHISEYMDEVKCSTNDILSGLSVGYTDFSAELKQETQGVVQSLTTTVVDLRDTFESTLTEAFSKQEESLAKTLSGVESMTECLQNSTNMVLSGLSEGYTDFREDLKQETQGVVQSLVGTVAELRGTFESALTESSSKQEESLAKTLSGVQSMTEALQQSQKEQVAAMDAGMNVINRSVKESSGAVAEFIGALTEESQETEEVISRIMEVQVKLEESLHKFNSFPEAVTALAEIHNNSNSDLQGLIQQVRGWIEREDQDNQEGYQRLEDFIEKHNVQTQEYLTSAISPVFKEVSVTLKKTEEVLMALGKNQEGFQKSSQKITESSKEYARVVHSIGRYLDDAAKRFAANLDEIQMNRGNSAEMFSAQLQAFASGKDASLAVDKVSSTVGV